MEKYVVKKYSVYIANLIVKVNTNNIKFIIFKLIIEYKYFRKSC